MENQERKNWGGTRKGAGRKPKPVETVNIGITLEKPVADLLDAEAKASGRSRTAVIVDALLKYTKK